MVARSPIRAMERAMVAIVVAASGGIPWLLFAKLETWIYCGPICLGRAPGPSRS
jgi:hypothetical protein